MTGQKATLAVLYDFDRTLSPDDMQAQGYIQSVGYDVERFWKESNELAEKNEMDANLAYMYKMVKEAEGNLILNRQALLNYGAKVKLYNGVESWFGRVNGYGEKRGVNVEHYIISSGLKEMIEGTSVAGQFKKIYASSFYFNSRGVAVWPAQVVNFTSKTQFLFRISKGVTDINDGGVNNYFPQESLRVPFRNMVYLGDSATDVPCMKLVNSYGGHSVGVYDPQRGDDGRVKRLLKENRIRYFAPADYSEGSELERLLFLIIDKTAAYERLEDVHVRNKQSADED